MQMRFGNRQRRRVYRTLAHPRFRAAFDFLLLRHAASGEHAADVAYWQSLRAQQPATAEDEAALDAWNGETAPVEAGAEEGADAAPRRRRRRRRGPSAPAGE